MRLSKKITSLTSIFAVGIFSVTGVALAEAPIHISSECVDTNNREQIRHARNLCDEKATAGVLISVCTTVPEGEIGHCEEQLTWFSVGIFRPENPTDETGPQTLGCINECTLNHDGTQECQDNQMFVCEGGGKQTTGLRPAP